GVERERVEEVFPDLLTIQRCGEVRDAEEGIHRGARTFVQRLPVALDGSREQAEGLPDWLDEGDVLVPPLHLPPLVTLRPGKLGAVAVERLVEDREDEERRSARPAFRRPGA